MSGWADGIVCAGQRAWNLCLGQTVSFKTPREIEAKETVDEVLKIYAGALYGLPGLPRLPMDEAHKEMARLLREAMFRFGGFFLKVGQYAVQLRAARREYVEALAGAQGSAESRSSRAYVCAQIAAFDDAQLEVPELRRQRPGAPLECKSASMAVVFRGTYRGRAAAVKVVHESASRAGYHGDLHLADLLSRYLEGQPEARGVRASIAAVRGRLLGMLDSELDLTLESENQARLHRFARSAGLPIVVPEPLDCTASVLVSEWLEGPTAAEALEQLRGEGEGPAPADLAPLLTPDQRDAIFEAYGRFLFDLGESQSDPHPGNFVLLPGGRVGLVDYGLHARFPPEVQRGLADFLAALPPEPEALDADPARTRALLRAVGVAVERPERAPAVARHLFHGDGDGIFPEADGFEAAYVPAIVIVMYLASLEKAAAAARAARGLPDRDAPAAVLDALRAASTARFAPLRALR